MNIHTPLFQIIYYLTEAQQVILFDLVEEVIDYKGDLGNFQIQYCNLDLHLLFRPSLIIKEEFVCENLIEPQEEGGKIGVYMHQGGT